MKNLLLLNMLFILLVSFIWGCQNFEMTADNYMGDSFITSVGDVITQIQPYTGPEIPLVNKQGQQVGKLIVFTASDLHVEFFADKEYTINNVQLWIGTEVLDVPMNKQGIPTPGKFTYKASDQSEYEFTIKLSDITTNYGEILGGNQSICIFAHAEMQNIQTNTINSVWSEGASFGTSRWGSYSEFICQPSGGRGCFRFSSNCGIEYNGTFYYNNEIGSYQNIYTEYGKEVGTVSCKNDTLYFLLTGNWSILGQEGVSPLTYQGFSDPGTSDSDLITVYELGNGKSEGYYTKVQEESNYYLLDLKIQYCD